jgi:hypothetical protein
VGVGLHMIMPNHFCAIVIIRDVTVGAGLVPALGVGINPNGVSEKGRPKGSPLRIGDKIEVCLHDLT